MPSLVPYVLALLVVSSLPGRAQQQEQLQFDDQQFNQQDENQNFDDDDFNDEDDNAEFVNNAPNDEFDDIDQPANNSQLANQASESTDQSGANISLTNVNSETENVSVSDQPNPGELPPEIVNNTPNLPAPNSQAAGNQSPDEATNPVVENIPTPWQGTSSNKQAFYDYFRNEISGRGEGVFMIRSEKASMFVAPDDSSQVVTVLRKGAYVHALEQHQNWLRVGRREWVQRGDVHHLGLKTKGLRFPDQKSAATAPMPSSDPLFSDTNP